MHVAVFVRELVEVGDVVKLAVGVCVPVSDGVIVELCEGGNIVVRGTGAASMRVPGGADSKPSAPQTSQNPTPGRTERTRLLRAYGNGCRAVMFTKSWQFATASEMPLNATFVPEGHALVEYV